MIHSVSIESPDASRPEKTIELQPGLNIILSETTQKSVKTDSRNGTGKTSFIAIIDYCLGCKNDFLQIEALIDYALSISMDLGGQIIKITRYVGSLSRRVYIIADTTNWDIQPQEDEDTGKRFYKLEDWQLLLGHFLFNLPLTKQKYEPTFRMLISYFVRFGDYAYSNPIKLIPQAESWQYKVPLAYLFQLDWEIARDFQRLESEKKEIDTIEKTLKRVRLGEYETELIHVKADLKNIKVQLDSYNVHPQFQDISNQADQLTAEIHSLLDRIAVLQRRIKNYEKSFEQEVPPSTGSLERLYEQTGIIFPDYVKKTLLDAQTFHQQIIQNRRAFLENEIKSLNLEIRECNSRLEVLVPKKAELMNILASNGAIPEYNSIQQQYMKLQARKEFLTRVIADVKTTREKRDRIKDELSILCHKAESDKSDRMQNWEEIVVAFNNITKQLYNKEGNLILDINDKKGYEFKLEIGDKDQSTGISRMKVFSLDYVLLQLWAKQEGCIDFLVHDSIIFEPVDSRQIEMALMKMATMTTELNAQYICTINSDRIQDFKSESIHNYVRYCLKDDSEEGLLFGFEYNSKKIK